MSNSKTPLPPQPSTFQRLAPQVATSATSPFSSPPANHHLRQPPHLNATHNPFPQLHFRRLTPAPARRNPNLRPGNYPCAPGQLINASLLTSSPRHPAIPSPRHPFTPSPSHPFTPSPLHPFTLSPPHLLPLPPGRARRLPRAIALNLRPRRVGYEEGSRRPSRP